jgi:hypothetical protein
MGHRFGQVRVPIGLRYVHQNSPSACVRERRNRIGIYTEYNFEQKLPLHLQLLDEQPRSAITLNQLNQFPLPFILER